MGGTGAHVKRSAHKARVVVTDLSRRAVAVFADPVPDPALRQQLRLSVDNVNRLRGLLHQIPFGRGLHHEHVAERYPGYTFAELTRIAGLSGVLIASNHHTRVSCNPDLEALIIEPDGSYTVVWAKSAPESNT